MITLDFKITEVYNICKLFILINLNSTLFAEVLVFIYNNRLSQYFSPNNKLGFFYAYIYQNLGVF